jgi:hypothetical protein
VASRQRRAGIDRRRQSRHSSSSGRDAQADQQRDHFVQRCQHAKHRLACLSGRDVRCRHICAARAALEPPRIRLGVSRAAPACRPPRRARPESCGGHPAERAPGEWPGMCRPWCAHRSQRTGVGARCGPVNPVAPQGVHLDPVQRVLEIGGGSSPTGCTAAGVAGGVAPSPVRSTVLVAAAFGAAMTCAAVGLGSGIVAGVAVTSAAGEGAGPRGRCASLMRRSSHDAHDPPVRRQPALPDNPGTAAVRARLAPPVRLAGDSRQVEHHALLLDDVLPQTGACLSSRAHPTAPATTRRWS